MIQISDRFRTAFIERVAEQPSSDEAVHAANVLIVVTCKGRLKHLKYTLPLMLSQRYPHPLRVAVVDYGDPDNAFGFCVSLGHPRLAAVRVLDATHLFNLSRARNCGANLLAADILCFVDADSILHPQFVDVASRLIRSGHAVLTHRDFRDRILTTCGVCCVSASTYRQIHGYDEAFEGWGPEDRDFCKRSAAVGQVRQFPAWVYPATIPHSNDERTRFYEIRDMGVSAGKGMARLADEERGLNKKGYGRAHAEVFIAGHTSTVEERLLAEPDQR